MFHVVYLVLHLLVFSDDLLFIIEALMLIMDLLRLLEVDSTDLAITGLKVEITIVKLTDL